MHIVLFEPEIPPNTGNVARLCAAMDVELHLIQPLGFSLSDKHLKRAGLDYWPHVRLTVHEGWRSFLENFPKGSRRVATSSNRGEFCHEFAFRQDDWLVFGPETRGLPDHVYDGCTACVRIPILGKVRSLNLSTAAGIVLYEAMRNSAMLPEGIERME